MFFYIGFRKIGFRKIGFRKIGFRKLEMKARSLKLHISLDRSKSENMNVNKAEIVVWGGGQLANLYLDQHGASDVVAIVDGHHPSGRNDFRGGIPIYSPQEFFSSEHSAKKIVICSMFFHQIVPLLEQHNVAPSLVYVGLQSGDRIEIMPLDELSFTIEEYEEGYQKYELIRDTIDSAASSIVADDRYAVLQHALSMVSLDGLYLEFGVYKGDSLNHLCQWSAHTFYGFDSFEGLPEDWISGVGKGAFSLSGSVPTLPPNAVPVKGWFSDTLPGFLEEHAGTVAFLHLDADIYSSTLYVLNSLVDRIAANTIIVFDEYMTHLDPKFEEYTAFQEVVEANDIQYEYICRSNASAAVRIL